MVSVAAGKRVVIVGAKRTPIGTFMGGLSSLRAPELGVVAAQGALAHAGLAATDVQEVYFGNVLQANVGQAPARQVALGAGCALDTPSTTVNKVCASGMKAAMLAASAIRLGDRSVMLAGGMESMSNAPHYLRNSRKGTAYGDFSAIDAIAFDGLTDAYDNVLMGACTERVVEAMGFTRQQQDDFAINSYEKARAAQAAGILAREIVPVEVKSRKGSVTVSEDEECKKFLPEKFAGLRPAFKKDGTITAANASKINDGAAAMVLMEEEEALARGLKPLARIVNYTDAAVAPFEFGIAPATACRKLMEMTGLTVDNMDAFEFNEAFAVVGLANAQLLGLPEEKTNVHGGACALGHPIGVSGSRIMISLLNVLQETDGTFGMASICNGGGGASAIAIERLN